MNAINIEVMLLNWSVTANGGAKIVLQLPDEEALEPFKSMTLAKGKHAGQRLAAAFVEVGEDEKPVEHKRHGAGPLAQLAGRWCADVAFQHWLAETHRSVWDAWHHIDHENAEDAVADCVRTICGVESRRELDTNPNAGRSFHKLIREPFQAWLQERRGG